MLTLCTCFRDVITTGAGVAGMFMCAGYITVILTRSGMLHGARRCLLGVTQSYPWTFTVQEICVITAEERLGLPSAVRAVQLSVYAYFAWYGAFQSYVYPTDTSKN